MNYLSHLFLSQRTPMSFTGNLMGDFKQDIGELALPDEIRLGIQNHHFVDKCTDRSVQIKQLRKCFSPQRRRFAGVISDITFDYFLIKHWQHFDQGDFDDFIEQCYQGLLQCQQYMPVEMARVVALMTNNDWLRAYSTLDGISMSIDQVAKRIRFKNTMTGGIEEVQNNYDEFEQAFMVLFAELQRQVKMAAIEVLD